MVIAANRLGYAGATVSEVIAEAGVSRPTFYEHFDAKEDCFLAAGAYAHERLFAVLAEALEREPPEHATAVGAETLIEFARSEHALARLLTAETLAGGPRALDARDGGIDELAEVVEHVLEQVGGDQATPDVPVAVMLGTVSRLIAARLRRGERAMTGLHEDIRGWVHSYERPAAARRWQRVAPGAHPGPSPYLASATLRPPPPLGPGRPRISRAEVVENQRQRIMFATARVVAQRGFSAATIGEIAKLARLDARVFSQLFADPHEAFGAIQEQGFQELVATTARAYFAGSSWPERVWEALRAATQSIERDPTLARVGFVEAYAAGARAIQRVEDGQVAFTIFLQEGSRHASQRGGLSRAALEAIITSVFEVVYRETRASTQPQPSRLLSHLGHLCLTPFMGPDEADRFLELKLRANRKQGADKRRSAR